MPHLVTEEMKPFTRFTCAFIAAVSTGTFLALILDCGGIALVGALVAGVIAWIQLHSPAGTGTEKRPQNRS